MDLYLSRAVRRYLTPKPSFQTYKLAKENPSVIFVSLSPGWVKTGARWASPFNRPADILLDMGGAGAQIEITDSVKAMIRLLHGVRPEDSGMFLNREGKPLPW